MKKETKILKDNLKALRMKKHQKKHPNDKGFVNKINAICRYCCIPLKELRNIGIYGVLHS